MGITSPRAVAWRAGAVIVLLAALITGCTQNNGREHDTGLPARVGATDSSLTLDGAPWWPAGLNAYGLATDWSVNEGCGAQVDLDTYFASLAPNSVTRFNAFQMLAIDKRTGARDFGPIDAVFAAAEKAGQLVLPVLAPQDGSCDDLAFKDRSFYDDGWRTVRSPSRSTFAEWVTTAVTRWHGSTALAGWTLVGEPEPSICDGGGDCSLHVRSCPPDAAAVLRTFMDSAGALVRVADPSHLILSGMIGGSQCGSAGDDFETVNDSPGVDVVEMHDYDDVASDEGDTGLRHRMEQARRIGKPLLVGEIGIEAGSCLSIAARSETIAARLGEQRSAGTAGALLWAYVPDPRPDLCTYDIGPADPVRVTLAAHTTLG